MAPRLDRVQYAMPGSVIVFVAKTYKSVIDTIVPNLMEYFNDNYERGVYFEIGKRPPSHFKKCYTEIENWKNTISFVSGSVVQIVSCDRPESMIGKNTVHIFVDEMLCIPRDKFMERILPALRSDRAKFGHSEYFMGISGFSSTPNFETDYDWFLDYEKNMNKDLIPKIQEIAFNIDLRLYKLEIARQSFNFEEIKKLERFIERWLKRLTEIRRGQTFYLRASSFYNIKNLGLEYIKTQINSTSSKDEFNSNILAIRRIRVKDMFFANFGKQHLFDDGYNYISMDNLSLGEKSEESYLNLRFYDKKLPLYAGYDAGPFQSIVFAQRFRKDKEFRVLKNMWVYDKEQQDVLAKKIDNFFSGGRKEIILHYDRAANQKDPEWKKFYPNYKEMGVNDTDAVLLKKELTALGWNVILMSKDQKTIFYQQHYRLLNLLFGKYDGKRDKILIDRNECEALVSSINHSPLKRNEGRIMLDKSSERLPFEEQALNSTQLSSAFMYLLWGEYNKLLPDSDLSQETPKGAGTYMS